MIVDAAAVPRSLRLAEVDGEHFRIEAGGNREREVVTGTHLMAYAIVASGLGGSGDHRVKSAHGVFARPVSHASEVDVEVERLHAGRAFGADTVTFRQNGRAAARVQLLLSADEPDLIRHADAMPAVGGPEDARPFGPTGGTAGEGLELRVVGDADYLSNDHAVAPPELCLWIRATAPVDGAVLNQALLCAGTGTMLIGTALLPHAGIGQEQAHRTISTGVVGHTISFHEPFDLRDWLLLAQESIYAGHGRSHGRARVFTSDGALVASYVQDNMIRHFTDGADHSADYRTVM